MLCLNNIAERVKSSKLEQHEIPILQKISQQIRVKKQQENSHQKADAAKLGGKASLTHAEISTELNESAVDFDKTLDDTEIYNEYSDVVLKSFPFERLLRKYKH
jgi:hypothetical protein